MVERDVRRLVLTPDLDLTVFLFCQGYTPEIRPNGNYHLYQFLECPKLMELKARYEAGNALVNPLALSVARRRLLRAQKEGGPM